MKRFIHVLEDDKLRKYLLKEEIILMPHNKKPIYKRRRKQRQEIKYSADVTNVNSNSNRIVEESSTAQTDVTVRRK